MKIINSVWAYMRWLSKIYFHLLLWNDLSYTRKNLFMPSFPVRVFRNRSLCREQPRRSFRQEPKSNPCVTSANKCAHTKADRKLPISKKAQCLTCKWLTDNDRSFLAPNFGLSVAETRCVKNKITVIDCCVLFFSRLERDVLNSNEIRSMYKRS